MTEKIPLTTRPHQEDGPSCPGCGLPNYSGLCPVCRGDESAYVEELQPFFGPWNREDDDRG
jgi:hypothetical protein